MCVSLIWLSSYHKRFSFDTGCLYSLYSSHVIKRCFLRRSFVGRNKTYEIVFDDTIHQFLQNRFVEYVWETGIVTWEERRGKEEERRRKESWCPETRRDDKEKGLESIIQRKHGHLSSDWNTNGCLCCYRLCLSFQLWFFLWHLSFISLVRSYFCCRLRYCV